MPRSLSFVVAFVLLCRLPASWVLGAETDVWRTIFSVPQKLAAVDEPIVCILTIQHPEIIRGQLVGKPAADYSVGYDPGQFKESGFTPVRIVRRDPLFEGLPEEVVVREAHAYHVVQVPDGFELLASTAECKVQAFKHRQRMVYGTQFHPEVNDDDHPHGPRDPRELLPPGGAER